MVKTLEMLKSLPSVEANGYATIRDIYSVLEKLVWSMQKFFESVEGQLLGEVKEMDWQAMSHSVREMLTLSERVVYDREATPGDEDKISHLILQIQKEKL